MLSKTIDAVAYVLPDVWVKLLVVAMLTQVAVPADSLRSAAKMANAQDVRVASSVVRMAAVMVALLPDSTSVGCTICTSSKWLRASCRSLWCTIWAYSKLTTSPELIVG